MCIGDVYDIVSVWGRYVRIGDMYDIVCVCGGNMCVLETCMI